MLPSLAPPAGILDGVSDPERKSLQAGSFGAAADVYERARPDYPDQAIDWLLPPGARRVLDLGAGTGKLTRGLAARGLDVTAVEPSAGMREQLARVLPGVTVLDGQAERIPAGAGAADAVLVAQAWHWVDPPRAVPEVARVLAPGGRLGLVWNIRDSRVDWVARLSEIIHGRGYEDYSDATSQNPTVGPPFGPLHRHEVEWAKLTTPDELIDLVSSRSYIITMAPDERAGRLAQVRDLLATHPSIGGAAEFPLPYVTRCYRADLPA
jgi:SAM-dependent methyltransferase